jgi:hypothetical protein
LQPAKDKIMTHKLSAGTLAYYSGAFSGLVKVRVSSIEAVDVLREVRAIVTATRNPTYSYGTEILIPMSRLIPRDCVRKSRQRIGASYFLAHNWEI